MRNNTEVAPNPSPPEADGGSLTELLDQLADIPTELHVECLPDGTPSPSPPYQADERHAEAQLRRKIMGYIVTQAIHAVVELGVIDHLAGGPRPVTELTTATGTNPDALHRYLRALAGEGLFREHPPGTFALTTMGGLLRSDTPGSLRHLVALMVDEPYEAWALAGYTLLTGRPAFDQAFGEPFFAWLAQHPLRAAEFDAAQAALAERRMAPLLDRDWTGVSTVVDVGGGNGTLLARLLQRHHHLRGVLVDLAHVVTRAHEVLAAAGVQDRCRCVPGDFFADIPRGDVYVLAQVLHDWDDDRAGDILRRCRTAMPDHARLVILEQVVPEDNRPHPAKLLDLHMLLLLGGRERTQTQWQALLATAGFTIEQISRSARSALIEARPK
jgi:SAM-dependent methyltransferase